MRRNRGGANGCAGEPPLVGVAPFLILRATVVGTISAASGMVVNIKQVDRILRAHAVKFLRRVCYVDRRSIERMMPRLYQELRVEFLTEKHWLVEIELVPSPFLSLGVSAKEPEMVRLSQRFEFSAAHRLHSKDFTEQQNREVFGKCNNPNGHGHNYELEVTVAGEVSHGGVMAIPMLQKIVNAQVVERFDHKHLNLDCVEFQALNPTVENIAKVIFERLEPAIPGPARLVRVKVWETPKTMAEYGEE